ncbi:hypothetical protein AA0112_g821 [Alternaria arborescens]|nr:hypothetical protein AA0112_g821 [Alternaria arborescens]
MSNLQYSRSTLHPTAGPISSPSPSIKTSSSSTPRAKFTTDVLTTVRAHQIMLTNLYVAQNNAYTSAYTAFATQCIVRDMVHTDIKDVVTKLLGQQKDIMLFQTFLKSFQDFVVGLEGNVSHEIDED